MNRDRIIIRMPEQLEFFFAAVAVTHDYVMQQARQIAQGVKNYQDLGITVELGHEEQFFFAPLFPRLEVALRSDKPLSRKDWDCVVDLRSVEEALRISMIPQKHLTDCWGIMHGANPKRIPELGCIAAMIGEPTIDVIIDNNVEEGEKLKEFFNINVPHLTVETMKVDGCRAAQMFNRLATTKMYIGKRSAATYIATLMKRKQVVELYTNDLPLWFLAKNVDGNYKVFYGKAFSAEMIWLGCEELMEKQQWITSGMTFPGVQAPA